MRIYEKIKKKLDLPTGKKARPSLLKNKMCFEQNWLANSAVSVESMRSLLTLPVLIIKITKTLGTVLSLSYIY